MSEDLRKVGIDGCYCVPFPSETEVRDLLAICEAADDQDTGSLEAFREAATVGMVAALCRAFLASV